jgi:hypothetical protein
MTPRLLCTGPGVLLFVAGCGDQQGAQATEPDSATARIQLDVLLGEEFEHDMGHWRASYTQSGTWRIERSGSDGSVRYTLRPDSGGSQSNVAGEGHHRCHDGSAWQHFDFYPPVEAETVTLSASAERGRLVLWTSLPHVWMVRRDAPADCLAVEPFRDHFVLHDGDLEAAGAVIDRFGNHRLADFAWEDVIAAAQGLTAPLSFAMNHEAFGVEFQVRGSIGQHSD